MTRDEAEQTKLPIECIAGETHFELCADCEEVIVGRMNGNMCNACRRAADADAGNLAAFAAEYGEDE